MRKLLAVALGCAALLAVAAIPASASHHKVRHCAAVRSGQQHSGPITARGASCGTARRVARNVLAGRRTRGWRCRATQYQGGATVTCRRARSSVRFQQAD